MSAKVRYPILFPVYFGLGMSVDIYVEYVHDMYAFTALETFIFLSTAISSRIFQYFKKLSNIYCKNPIYRYCKITNRFSVAHLYLLPASHIYFSFLRIYLFNYSERCPMSFFNNSVSKLVT